MLSPLEVERNELGYHVDEVRGKWLRVIRRFQPQSSRCVFLVHGGGGRAGQFKHQIRALETEENVIAVDFLGHGDSPKPDQPELYTADEHFEDLKSLYEKYKKERNVFVAHCYGSIHVLRLLKWLSDEHRLGEVSGLVVIALGVRAPFSSGGLVLKFPAFLLEWLRPLARSSFNQAAFSPATDPALIEFENTITEGNRMYMMKVLGKDCGRQENWDLWLSRGKEAIWRGHFQTTLICGDGDGVFPVSSCQNLRSFLDIPEEDFHVVVDAAHLSMLEKPEEVTRIIREVLSKENAQSAS